MLAEDEEKRQEDDFCDDGDRHGVANVQDTQLIDEAEAEAVIQEERMMAENAVPSPLSKDDILRKRWRGDGDGDGDGDGSDDGTSLSLESDASGSDCVPGSPALQQPPDTGTRIITITITITVTITVTITLTLTIIITIIITVTITITITIARSPHYHRRYCFC